MTINLDIGGDELRLIPEEDRVRFASELTEAIRDDFPGADVNITSLDAEAISVEAEESDNAEDVEDDIIALAYCLVDFSDWAMVARGEEAVLQ